MEDVLAKPVQTPKLAKKSSSKSLKPRRKVLVALRKPLTTKKAVEFLLKGTLKRKVCRYCLNIAYPLSDLDQCLSIGGQGALYNVTIRDMVASFHPFKVVDDRNLPNKICPKCLNHALQAYLFAQQCEQAERALRNCFDDMYDKMQKLDSVEPSKKRGRHKKNPNHNVLYTEHAKVMDYAEPIRNLINSGSISLTNEPVMSELECKKCWQVFPDVESLVYHEKIHPKSMWYHCRLCGQSFAKLFHFRKHMKTKHNSKSRSVPANETFTCNQCAFTSEDYSVHLQHIEKHKFKNVMEHLVQRKMDELCSVCLDKGPLRDLEKTVRLHGAYPELTGNRSLYNILGSTIPEKETHKYKELLVPSYANVLTITKKVKNTSVTSDEAEDLNLNTFIISDPFIVSQESADDKNMYMFIFSEPKILFPNTLLTIKEKNLDSVEELLKRNGNYYTDDTKRSKLDAHNVTKDNSIFSENCVGLIGESLENHSVGVKAAIAAKEQDEIEMDDGLKTCKYCWLFKKAGQCDVCKKKFPTSIDPKTVECFKKEIENNTIDTDTSMVALIKNSKTAYTKDSFKECKFCWVFKTVGKCDHCQTSFVNTFTNAVNIEDIQKRKTQKRPTNETTNETNTKKLRWECSICLTANDNNRDACLCCDAEALKDDSLRIKFGSTSYLKGILETSKKLLPNNTDEAKTFDPSKTNSDFADNSEESAKLSVKTMKTKLNDTALLSTTNNAEVVTINNDETNEMQCFDDSNPTNENLGDSNVYQEDAMDIEDVDDLNKPTSSLNFTPPIQNNTFNFLTPVTNIQTFLDVQPETFQFNIGSSFQDMKPARKIKRPLRRIATTFNK